MFTVTSVHHKSDEAIKEIFCQSVGTMTTAADVLHLDEQFFQNNYLLGLICTDGAPAVCSKPGSVK
jgi:hypothetical protein